jgi:hypothetical protein
MRVCVFKLLIDQMNASIEMCVFNLLFDQLNASMTNWTLYVFTLLFDQLNASMINWTLYVFTLLFDQFNASMINLTPPCPIERLHDHTTQQPNNDPTTVDWSIDRLNDLNNWPPQWS